MELQFAVYTVHCLYLIGMAWITVVGTEVGTTGAGSTYVLIQVEMITVNHG
jgi:hypothetical protein